MRHIIIVDNAANPQKGLEYGLSHAGLRVMSTDSIENALQIARHDPVDLILLIKTCTGEEGFTELLRLKEQADVPVICLSTQYCTVDEVAGLEMGADDYVAYSVHTDVLVARIKAVLRRTRPEARANKLNSAISVGDMVLDPTEHTVLIGKRPVTLRRREFQLLQVFLEHSGEVLSIADLLAMVWGDDYSGQPQVVYVTIRWLRQKIEDNPKKPRRIVTIPSVGYKLNCDL